MHNLIRTAVALLLLALVSCAAGGPLTPSDSFKIIRDAANSNDNKVILLNLSVESRKKIDTFIRLTGELKDNQLKAISGRSGIAPEKIRNLKPYDCIALYFAENTGGVNLRNIFNEEIVAIDVDGGTAVVKTSGGFELDFVREGPYWKFDLSRL